MTPPTLTPLEQELLEALRALLAAVKDNPTMQGREYVGLGIQVNNAISKAEQRPSTPSGWDREAVARIIRGWDLPPEGQRIGPATRRAIEEADAKADAILALAPPVPGGGFSSRGLPGPQAQATGAHIPSLAPALVDALTPFANFAADNTEPDTSDPTCGIWSDSSCDRERISYWFGPTDFRRAFNAVAAAKAASPPNPGEGGGEFITSSAQTCRADNGGSAFASGAAGDATMPVAWRVKDFADGWILCHTEEQARREAESAGNLVEPLFQHPPSDGTAG